jgi:hypothetical protein
MVSRMRKAELVTECQRLNLETWGTVPVLRTRIRDAHKAPLVSSSHSHLELLDRGHELYTRLRILFKTDILCVEKVINSSVESRFLACQEAIAQRVGLCEVVPNVFHGTDSMEPILREGFDASKSKRQVHGPGTYLATNPSMSMRYTATNKMLMCDVLVGDSSDNKLDRLRNPNIIVTKHSAGAIPRYVVTYVRPKHVVYSVR